MRDELKLKISLLPSSPGVYQYLNKEGTVIYVGKAKNLKRRVSSYFNRVHPVVRTNLLVRNIWDMKYIVVNSEEEALDLEANLIKEYQPRYNVLLKDDKSYPWICVTKELFPRVFLTREKHTKGAKYFGPYPKAEVAHALVDTLKQLYPIRTCRHPLTQENVENRKYKLCLQYHIKNCEGCCQGFVSHETYSNYIENITKILNGDTKQVSDFLMQEMMARAEELKFEEAEILKRKYFLLENYRAKSVIVNPSIHNVDVYSIVSDEGAAYVNFMHVRNGAIVQSMTVEYKVQDAGSDETAEEILSTAMRDMRERFSDIYKHDRVKEILVNIVPDFEIEGIEYVVPQRGDKRKLVAISLKNAEQYRTEKLKMMEKLNPEQRVTRTLSTMMKDLHLNELPRHIECFDNSSISGTNAVASCVVFKNAKPSKKDYRHFNIKEADGNDDYAQMREVIKRRYTRLLNENGELPQLLVVDGGKGQLNAAVEILDELGLRGTIATIGIAKRLDEIYFPGDSVPLYIDKNSETLRVIQKMRDEAHRFGITHHRNKRSKSQVRSVLDDIKGIGPKTRQALLKHFKSVKRIKAASEDEISLVVGTAKAKIVIEALLSVKSS
ncbi:MAG: excinuclease ABC subunit C [Muribaculaceae bacterium]|nr:excinuclease ABC subunit C [Muribaculaceae bacterium]